VSWNIDCASSLTKRRSFNNKQLIDVVMTVSQAPNDPIAKEIYSRLFKEAYKTYKLHQELTE